MNLASTMHRLLSFSSTTPTTRSKPKRRAHPRQLRLETLERREVFSTDLLAAFAFGSETGESAAVDLATDNAGNSYISGYFSGTVDFAPSATHVGDTDVLTARGVKDAYVAKYAPDDSLLWAVRMGGDFDTYAINGALTDSANHIAVDSSQNVYVVGNFLGTADFGTKIVATGGGRDNFVMKLNSAGAVQWANRFGGAGNDLGLGVGVDGSGNVYAMGVRYVPDPDNLGIDILKFNSAGSAVWVKSVNTGTTTADLTVDNSGNVFLAGQFSNSGGRSVDFDPGPKTNYQTAGGVGGAGYVLKLNNKGAFSWVSVFKGQPNSYSAASEITLDKSGNLLVGGYYQGMVDFNPGSRTTFLSGRGAFVTKLNNSGGLVWARSLDSNDSTGVHGLAVDSANNIYVVGNFRSTDFDPGSGNNSRTSAGSVDGYLLNLTSAGNFGWVETFGGAGHDRITAVAVDSNNTIHLAGHFENSVDFDPSAASFYLDDFGDYFSGFRLRLRRT